MILTAFLVVFLVISQSNALNDRMGDKQSPFRMSKLNSLWKKAQNKMSERKLSDLRRMFEMQDRAEMRWKELKANGGDKDGEMEAMIRRKFNLLLEEFGLEKHLDAGEGDKFVDNVAGHGVFGDKRLNDLWDSVQKQGQCLFLSLTVTYMYKLGKSVKQCILYTRTPTCTWVLSLRVNQNVALIK